MTNTNNEAIKDYYSILGISKNVPQKEIKTAFRKMIKHYHPDVCSRPDAHAMSVEILEAYEILSNIESRKKYDRIFKENINTKGFHDYESDFKETQANANTKAKQYAGMTFDEMISRLFEGLFEMGILGLNYVQSLVFESKYQKVMKNSPLSLTSDIDQMIAQNIGLKLSDMESNLLVMRAKFSLIRRIQKAAFNVAVYKETDYEDAITFASSELSLFLKQFNVTDKRFIESYQREVIKMFEYAYDVGVRYAITRSFD